MACLIAPCAELLGVGVCASWACKRCLHHGSEDSENWAEASVKEVEEIKHYVCMVSGAYATTLDRLQVRTGIDAIHNVTLHVDKEMHGPVPPHYIFTVSFFCPGTNHKLS
jgi:hypothetical protein